MKRTRHTPEQIVRKLRDADTALSEGKTVEDVCKQLEISEQTYHRWRNRYGGMNSDDMKRLRELEKENGRLKKAVADLTLDKQILQEVAEGNF